MKDLLEAFDAHPGEAGLIVLCGVVLVVLAVVVAARAVRAREARGGAWSGVQAGGDAGAPAWTILTAGVATIVSADGMWRTFEGLGMPLVLRVATFSFLELLVLQSAIRARQAMRRDMSPGVDGIAMWGWTLVSALLSATHEATGDDPHVVIVVVRFIAPLAAAWGWERSMALERKVRTGEDGGIRWSLTPERILIKLGLADPTGRSASEVGIQHRIKRVALAAQAARMARHAMVAAGKDRRGAYVRALRRLNREMERAVDLAGLGADPARGQSAEEMLVGHLSVLYNTETLLDLDPAAPWALPGPGLPRQGGGDAAVRPVPRPAPGRVPVVAGGESAGVLAAGLTVDPADRAVLLVVDGRFHRVGCPLMVGVAAGEFVHGAAGGLAHGHRPCPMCLPDPDPDPDRARSPVMHHPDAPAADASPRRQLVASPRPEDASLPLGNASPGPLALKTGDRQHGVLGAGSYAGGRAGVRGRSGDASDDAFQGMHHLVHQDPGRPAQRSAAAGVAGAIKRGILAGPGEHQGAQAGAVARTDLGYTAADLAALGSDAARVRAAVDVLGTGATVTEVAQWLAERGVEIARNSLRSAMQRARAAAAPELQGQDNLLLFKRQEAR